MTSKLWDSETKLDDRIHPSLYKIKNFHTPPPPFTRHRNRRGGIASYFHTSLAANRLTDLEVGEEEWLWAKVKLKNMIVLTCCLYLLPNQRAERLEEFLENFSEGVFKAQKHNRSVIILMGDFNDGNTLVNTLVKHSPTTSFERRLKETADSLAFTQLINEPTRYEGIFFKLHFINTSKEKNNLQKKCKIYLNGVAKKYVGSTEQVCAFFPRNVT